METSTHIAGCARLSILFGVGLALLAASIGAAVQWGHFEPNSSHAIGGVLLFMVGALMGARRYQANHPDFKDAQLVGRMVGWSVAFPYVAASFFVAAIEWVKNA